MLVGTAELLDPFPRAEETEEIAGVSELEVGYDRLGQ